MTARVARDPSPVRSALVHGCLGLLTLVATFGLGATAIHLVGDADAASPQTRLALFDESGLARPDLNPRLDEGEALRPVRSRALMLADADTGDDPDLGVDYDDGTRDETARPEITQAAAIRINGQTVRAGQSLSQVSSGAAPSPVRASPEAPAPVEMQVMKPTPTRRNANARAFTNAQNRPTVSVIVGGLGINRGRTWAAINELPPEVTLSFAPSTAGLQTWINRARAAGHEVLIEVPMEPYDYGRERPHPQVLQVAVSGETNARRLSSLLSRISGYTGLMNYQGGKFATSLDAASPVFELIAEKDLAFFEDGTLSRSVFDAAAREENVWFGRAAAWIDARPEADEISNQLLILEAEALEKGRSLGTGMSYPITLDLLKEWTAQLDDKGIVLAPASYYAQREVPAGQVEVAALDPQG